GTVRSAAARRAGRAARLGARGDLPDLQRGLRGDRRRRLDAPAAVRGRAAARPHPGRLDARRAGGARPGRADGDPGVARAGAGRPGRRADPAARPEPRALGSAPDPAWAGRARARGGADRRRARPLHAAGGDRRLPRPRPDGRGDRLGAHRRALRRARRAAALTGRRAKPRRRAVDGGWPGRRPRARRPATRRAVAHVVPLAAERAGPPARQARPPRRGARRVRARRLAHPQRARARSAARARRQGRQLGPGRRPLVAGRDAPRARRVVLDQPAASRETADRMTAPAVFYQEAIWYSIVAGVQPLLERRTIQVPAVSLRGRAGRYVRQPAGYRAFVRAPLPPEPPIRVDGDMLALLSRADQAVGRLDGVAQTLPNPDLFVAMYVRREAVLSSQIEGTQSTLEDLLAFELDPRGLDVPRDVEEVVNYVRAMNHGLERLTKLPLSLWLIREIHAELLTGVRGADRRPGEFRTTQNWIGASGARLNEATFVPPPVGDM